MKFTCFHKVLISAGLYIQIKRASSAVFPPGSMNWTFLFRLLSWMLCAFPLCISTSEWTFICHNSFLLQTEGPGFLWGVQSQLSLVEAWQACVAGFPERGQNPSDRGLSPGGTLANHQRVRPKRHEENTVLLDHMHWGMASVSTFPRRIPSQFWSVFVQIPPQGT